MSLFSIEDQNIPASLLLINSIISKTEYSLAREVYSWPSADQ